MIVLGFIGYLLFCSIHNFKEWFNLKGETNHLQTWFEQPAQPHYKTVFTEFVPNDAGDSWMFIVPDSQGDT